MKWFTIKAMSSCFELSYSTMRYYNTSGNKLDNKIVELLMFAFFVEQISLNSIDLKMIQHFFKRKFSIREEIESEKIIKNLSEKYWHIDHVSLELARELYLMNLSREQLQTIEQLKKGGE
jgi:hypothetical protein